MKNVGLWRLFGMLVTIAMSTPNLSAGERNNVNLKTVAPSLT
jgi:hypothetical protein